MWLRDFPIRYTDTNGANLVVQFSNLAQGLFTGKTITFTDNGGAQQTETLDDFTIDSVQPQVTSIAANENNTFKKVGSGAITITCHL